MIWAQKIIQNILHLALHTLIINSNVGVVFVVDPEVQSSK
jgi:hypothetical protein